jgi:hypothetical protein
MQWSVVPFDNNSAYDGTLKYMGASYVPDKKIYLTGGCFVNNSYPSSSVFEVQFRAINKPQKKKNMLLKRYGHSQIFLNGFIYCLGGFSHKDLPNEIPVTLASCERFSMSENQWAYVSTMNEARAFFGTVIVD